LYFDVVHFHNIALRDRILIGLLGLFGVKVILTIHGDSLKDQLENNRWVLKALLGFAMRQIRHIVVVKSEIRDSLLSLGVMPSRISVINAYLPPLNNSANIPKDISDFIDSHSPVLIGNGFGILPISEGSDLYGVELTMDLCRKLVKDYPKLGFLFFLAQIGDQRMYERLRTKIRDNGLQEHYVFAIGQELFPALNKATIFIRPSFRDGYSISIAEAIYLGVPTIASDVCERGAGAILFRSGDLNSLYMKVREVLDHYDEVKMFVEAHQPDSSYERLLSVYEMVTKG
jgi:glycosyltransferase involved in cell wall biosynthesis